MTGHARTSARICASEGNSLTTESDHAHPVDPDGVAAARAALVSRDEADDLARLLAVLGDPVRARILSALVATDELCVGDLALTLEVSEDAVSYALRLLRANGLVRRRAEGRMGYYRLASPGLRTRLDATMRDLRHLAGPEE